MFEELEFDTEQIPMFKLGLHIAQIVFAFVLWCLEISVFRAPDTAIDGNNGWTFAVCFLSVPAWIYLTMTPRFPRTRRFAAPQAMLTVDALFAVLWLSAFATQAAYDTANSCGSVCAESKAIVGLGFFVFLLFCLTTFLSIYTQKYWEWNGRLPGYDRGENIGGQNIDPDKAAFSMAPHDEEAYAPVSMTDGDHDADHDHDQDTSYGGAGSLHSDPYAPNPYSRPAPSVTSDPYATTSQSSYGGGGGGSAAAENPFRTQENPFESDSVYHHTAQSTTSLGTGYRPPSAQDEYEAEPAHFPSGNYDRIEP